MGGGTIGFPVLVLLFEGPTTLGRDFSFAIQSVGMTSASILIITKRQAVEGRILLGALLGTLVGTPLGLIYLSPHISQIMAKLVFAIAWAAFGLLHLKSAEELLRQSRTTHVSNLFKSLSGVIVGLLGSLTVVCLTGVGIDMLIYAFLVLILKTDVRVAIPTSVILMAFTSLVGVATISVQHDIQSGVLEHWLAAAPIVAVGAPLGVWFVQRTNRLIIIRIVSVLCLAQFAWTLIQVYDSLHFSGSLIACASVIGVTLLFRRLKHLGDLMKQKAQTESPPTA